MFAPFHGHKVVVLLMHSTVKLYAVVVLFFRMSMHQFSALLVSGGASARGNVLGDWAKYFAGSLCVFAMSLVVSSHFLLFSTVARGYRSVFCIFLELCYYSVCTCACLQVAVTRQDIRRQDIRSRRGFVGIVGRSEVGKECN